MSDNQPSDYVVDLAKRLVEHCAASTRTGSKRDDYCLHYWNGVIRGAALAGTAKMAEHLATIAIMFVSVDGYYAVAAMAAPGDAPDPSTMTMSEAARAIRARVDGVFDNPDLMKIGPLSTNLDEDVAEILRRVPKV